MIIAVRISGMVEVPTPTQETLFRLKLRRKYAAVLLHDNAQNKKLLESVRNYIAYGKISEELLLKLIIARGKSSKSKDGKIDAKHIIEELKKGKDLDELGAKGFFRLHPPRKGIESKKHFGVGNGVLGDNKNDIDKLVERML